MNLIDVRAALFDLEWVFIQKLDSIAAGIREAQELRREMIRSWRQMGPLW